MTDVKIEYIFENAPASSPVINRVYPAEVFDLFAGQQLVLVGRYRGKGPAKLKISGRIREETQSFEYDVKFAEPSSNSQFAFAARLWAVRRIGEIIDLVDLEGQNKELVDELVRLSTEHGILTPYTSYLADDLASPNDLSNRELNFGRSRDALLQLSQADGQSGFTQRGYKQMLKSADNSYESAPAAGAGAGGGLQMDSSRRPSRGDAGGNLYDSGGESSEKSIEEVVRRAGKETAYLRGNTLVASNAVDVDLEKDKAQIIEIKRFSQEYFELLKLTNKDENQLLALQGTDEEMVVRLQGKIYRIN